MDTVRIMQVIETTNARRGEGVEGDPIRVLTQYWDMEGRLLAEVDPLKKGDEFKNGAIEFSGVTLTGGGRIP